MNILTPACCEIGEKHGSQTRPARYVVVDQVDDQLIVARIMISGCRGKSSLH